MNLAGRALIPMVFVVMAACSRETSVTPPFGQQGSAQVAQERNYSFLISPSDRTVRVRFARVRSDGTESVSSFMRRMFASADSAGARQLVLDLRATRGGDAFLVVPLIKGVLARERFAEPGGLIVFVGPESYSPGQNAATLLQQYASPIFVRDAP